MIGFPFDSHVTYDSEGTPSYDRAITSAPYRKLLKELFTTGIMPTDSTNMQVGTGTDMTVVVEPGFAMVEGCMKLEEDERTLTVQASDSTYDRIDTVVLRLNDNDSARICDFYIVEGTPAESPVHPALTREGSIYEIGLADLFITKNSTAISAAKITDTRYDTERCGVVSSISEFDTETLNQQMNAWCEEQRTEFSAWVESIKDILDESTAGHLQLEIDAINTEIDKNNIPTELSSDQKVGEALATLNTNITNIEETVKSRGVYELWSGTVSSASQTVTYELSDSIDNYDLISIEWYCYDSYGKRTRSEIFPSTLVKKIIEEYQAGNIMMGCAMSMYANSSWYGWMLVSFTDLSTFIVNEIINMGVLRGIEGIKL